MTSSIEVVTRPDGGVDVLDSEGQPIDYDKVVLIARRGEVPRAVVFKCHPLEMAFMLLEQLAMMADVQQAESCATVRCSVMVGKDDAGVNFSLVEEVQ